MEVAQAAKTYSGITFGDGLERGQYILSLGEGDIRHIFHSVHSLPHRQVRAGREGMKRHSKGRTAGPPQVR